MSVPKATLLKARVVNAAAREFWLEGELSCPCCLIILRDESGQTWRVYYDDETYRWYTSPWQEPFPEIGTVIGDEDFQYRHVQLSESDKIVGSRIINIEEYAADGSAHMEIIFENDFRLECHHTFSDETSGFEVVRRSVA